MTCSTSTYANRPRTREDERKTAEVIRLPVVARGLEPAPEDPGLDADANGHMPILFGEVAVMRPGPHARLFPILTAIVPSLIGWVSFAAIALLAGVAIGQWVLR